MNPVNPVADLPESRAQLIEWASRNGYAYQATITPRHVPHYGGRALTVADLTLRTGDQSVASARWQRAPGGKWWWVTAAVRTPTPGAPWVEVPAEVSAVTGALTGAHRPGAPTAGGVAVHTGYRQVRSWAAANRVLAAQVTARDRTARLARNRPVTHATMERDGTVTWNVPVVVGDPDMPAGALPRLSSFVDGDADRARAYLDDQSATVHRRNRNAIIGSLRVELDYLNRAADGATIPQQRRSLEHAVTAAVDDPTTPEVALRALLIAVRAARVLAGRLNAAHPTATEGPTDA